MVMPKSIDAYDDCEVHFERALLAPNGIAVTVATPAEAHKFRLKMNTYREKIRKNSRKIYELDDNRYGVSPYDKFRLTIDKDNPCRVFIQTHRIEVSKVEEL